MPTPYVALLRDVGQVGPHCLVVVRPYVPRQI